MKDHMPAHAGPEIKKMLIEHFTREGGDEVTPPRLRDCLLDADILSLFGIMVKIEGTLGVVFNLDMLLAASAKRRDVSFEKFFLLILEGMGILERKPAPFRDNLHCGENAGIKPPFVDEGNY